MQHHTKLYFNYFGFDESSFVSCEMPDCRKQANDIHHVNARGMGGDPLGKKDVIENLMAMCADCHLTYGDKKQFKEYLKQVHLIYMQNGGR